MPSFSEPEELKRNISEISETTLHKQEQNLRQNASAKEMESYFLRMSTVNDPGLKNLHRLGESLLKKNDIENAKKILTVVSVYVYTAGKEDEFKDFNDSVRALQLINLDVIYAFAKRIEQQVNGMEFKEVVDDIRGNISRYGKNTQKFVQDALNRIEQLYEKNPEAAKAAINLLDYYLANIIEKNIIKGAGRKEIERAIQQCINGEDYVQAWENGIALNNLYLKSREHYGVWKKFFDAVPNLLADDEIKKSFTSLDEKSKQGDLAEVISLSSKIENRIEEKIRENLNAMSGILVKYGKQLVRFRGYQGYDKLFNDFVELNKQLKKLASDDNINLLDMIKKSSSLTESFNDLMQRTNGYLYVAQMLEKEESYYLYLKDNDPKIANLMKDEYSSAISGLKKCLDYLAKGEFALAGTQFSSVLYNKQNLLAATGLGAENFDKLQFYADAHQFLFGKLIGDAMLKEGENKAIADLQSRLFMLESALRLSSKQLFVGGEEAPGKRIFSNSRELILATLEEIKGRTPMINIGDYERLVDKDIEELRKKMELGQKRASYAEFFVSFWPPAFVAIALKEVFHEQYVKGEVSGMSWAMLAFSASWLKSFRLAVEGVGKLGRAGQLFKTTINTSQSAIGIGMLGLGSLHAYEQFKAGNFSAGYELLAQLAIVPAYMAGGAITKRWKKYYKIGNVDVDRRTYSMLRSAGLVEQRPTFLAKLSDKIHLPRLLAEERGSVVLVSKRAPVPKRTKPTVPKLTKPKKPKQQPSLLPELQSISADISRKSAEFINNTTLSMVGIRERIPLGNMEGLNNAVKYFMSEGHSCFVAVLDKSLLNLFNNIGREVGDIAIDLYVAAIKKALQAINQKYPGLKILVQRTSQTSDEVTIAFLADDRRKLAEVRKIIDKEFQSAEKSLLEEAHAMTYRGKNLGEFVKNLKDEKEIVSSYAKKSDVFTPKMLTDEVVALAVSNAENKSSLMYKDTIFNFFSRSTTYEKLRKKYGLGEELSFKSNMQAAQLNAPGTAFEIKLILKPLDEKLFNSLINETVYKSLREVIEDSFGVRALNTFFGYGATNYISTIVDDVISNFVKKHNAAVAGTGKGIEIRMISPLKYIFTSGYDEGVAKQLQDEITKAFMEKNIKISGVSMTIAEVRAAESAPNILTCKSLGLELGPEHADDFIRYANRLVAIIKGFKPEASKKYIGHLPIYDDLVKVFSEGKNSKILRNVEDLIVYLRERGRGDLVDKLTDTVLKYGPSISAW